MPNKFVLGLTIMILFVFSESIAGQADRPFWTEKSSFVEANDLFVVGIASGAATAEQARKDAFQNGTIELMNYAQITSLEAKGLVIETQMTYEEMNENGTYKVFRLLRVPVTKLLEIQERVTAQNKLHEGTLDQSRLELAAGQQALSGKQRELERRAQDIEGTVRSISQLQITLGEKALKIDQQQKQVELLLQRLGNSVPQAGSEGATHKSAGLMEKLHQTEVQLDQAEERLELISRRIKQRIDASSQKACKYIVPGMMPREVTELLGEPDGKRFGFDSDNTWNYGRVMIHFNGQGTVNHLSDCR